MSLYQRIDTGEIRDIDPTHLASLHPNKQAMWQAYTPPPPPPPSVPESVSPRQIRRALNATGLRTLVEQAVANSPQDIRDEWEYALEVRRDYPLLNTMAEQLGMTSEQLDGLFIAAAAIE